MAEPEILPDDDLFGGETSDNHMLDERFTAQLRKRFIEGQCDQGIDPQRFDVVRLVLKRRQSERRIVRPEKTSWMRFECQNNQGGFRLTRQIAAATDNSLMPAMHTVEIAQHYDARARAFRNFFKVPDDLHIQSAFRPPDGPNLSRPCETV